MSEGALDGEKELVQTTCTHEGSFPHRLDNGTYGTYFDQKVPVPEEDGEVIHRLLTMDSS